jgi:hypothetical protein
VAQPPQCRSPRILSGRRGVWVSADCSHNIGNGSSSPKPLISSGCRSDSDGKSGYATTALARTSRSTSAGGVMMINISARPRATVRGASP